MDMDKQKQISTLARDIIRLSHDGILMNMRFLDVALSALKLEEKAGMGVFAYDGSTLYYDPVLLLSRYHKEPHYMVRLYLHVLLHAIFYHSFQTDKLEKDIWNLATDIAVENTILEMNLYLAAMPSDTLLKSRLDILKKQAGGLSAEKLYRHFRVEPPSHKALRQWRELCYYDEHLYWDRKEELTLSQEQWRKVSERIKADLKSFSKDKNNAQSMEENLREATRQRYDYRDFLKRFMVMGETLQVNDDEFDYIYYTYGLSQYGNMPLVEPLEYKDANKIKDFVIAIDTSASCRGEVVQAFLQQTYQIMQQRENFFRKINVHIIQCDNEVQSDTKITCREDFDDFLKSGKLHGFGSTDFRPVFAYVEKLRQDGGFENLKGLLYFTDGYGIYPDRMPDYDTAFVFLREDGEAPEVPPWAIKVVITKEQCETEKEEDGDSDEY
ncbi:MAG: VWA-like domain-containing protein [Bacillus sp. (in: Bacteria)]|nr:VWA-like domain-containing protein [Bacillus sp. (in: firmicutes)]MCM1427557.1 VWA-like domain-containing protein [Eubacterium sp.]